ncbi:hypothetical protein BGX28_004276 [Mortierella sp. GBA30]|nr:hypothetical protein BGX28_004276 [Mortierella sp. GBA30]
MMYYVSWMKLLQTISTGSSNVSNNNSNSNSKSNPDKASGDGETPSYQCTSNCDNASSDVTEPPEISSFDGENNAGEGKGPPDNGFDCFSDMEDEDPSGILRLAESQRHDQVQIGWGGNCTSDRECSITGAFSSHPRDLFQSEGSPREDLGRSPTATKPQQQHRPREGVVAVIISTDAPVTKPHYHQQRTRLSHKGRHSCPGFVPVPVAVPIVPYVRPCYGHLIRVLDFSHLYYIISDKFLSHLFPHTPNLLELIINSPKQFSDTSLITLSQSCSSLRRLELPGCTKITDRGLWSILEQCLHLHTLVLSNGASQNLSDRCLCQLAHTLGGSLRVLNMANANARSSSPSSSSSSSSVSSTSSSSTATLGDTFPDPKSQQQQQHPLGLMTIAISCQNLISLNISHCNLVSDLLLSRLSDSLQSLNVAHCLEITDEGLRLLAIACPDLRDLDITALSLVTDRGVLEIGQGCKKFRRLVIDDKYGRVTENVLRCFPWGAEVVQRRMMLASVNHGKRDVLSAELGTKIDGSKHFNGTSALVADDVPSVSGAISKVASSNSVSESTSGHSSPKVAAASTDLIDGALSDFEGSDLSDLSSGSSASGSDREMVKDEEGNSSDDNASTQSKGGDDDSENGDDDEDKDESMNDTSASDDPRPRLKAKQTKRPFGNHTKSRTNRVRRIQSDSSEGDEDEHEASKRKPGRPSKVKKSPQKSTSAQSPTSPVSPTFSAFAKKIGNGPSDTLGIEGIFSNTGNETLLKKKTKQPDFVNIGKRDRSGRTQLFKYTALGDLEICQKLIEAGAQVNDRDYAEWTPLHEACVTGHEKVAELLLLHHADVNARGGHMDTPLHDAAQNGHVEVVRLLLAHGANVLAKNAKGIIPIDVSDDKEVVELLQKRQALVSMLTGRNQAGQTMLHRACSSGSYNNVADLLNQGADINAQDNAQWTPLHEAALAGHTKVVDLLLSRGADPNAQGHGNDTALHDAAQNEHEDVVRLLLEYGGDPDFKNAKGEKPCDVCEDDSILELLKNGARGTKKPLPRSVGSISSSSSLSSLSSLSSKTSTPPSQTAQQASKIGAGKSKRQTEGGLDANLSDGGRSASEEKPVQMSRDERKMQQLLSTIRMQEQMEERKKAKQRRPKQTSDEEGDDDDENVKMSRSSKVVSLWKQPHSSSRNGKSSNLSNRTLSKSSRSGSIRRSSRSEERDESDSDVEKSTKPRRSVQRSAGDRFRIDHRFKDASGRTQLHQWAEAGDIEMVGTLLEGGADRDPKDHEGLTPLHLAAKAGNAEVLVLLLAYGCNVNAQDQDKSTALHEAVRYRHTEAVRLLLQNNALPNLRDSRKRTSMDLASPKDTEIRSLLKSSQEQAEVKAKERSKKRLSQMIETPASPKHKERKTSRHSDSEEPTQSRKKFSERREDDEKRGQHSRSSSSTGNFSKSSSMPSMSVARASTASSNTPASIIAAPPTSSTQPKKTNSETNGEDVSVPPKKQRLHSRGASLSGTSSVSQLVDEDIDTRSAGGSSKKRREIDRLSDTYGGRVKIKKEREDEGQHFRTPSLSLKSDDLRRVASSPTLNKDSISSKQGRHASKVSVSSLSRPISALGLASGSSIASISPPLTETSSSPPPTQHGLAAAQESEMSRSRKRSSQTFSSPSSYQKFADDLKLGGSVHQHHRQRSTSSIPSSRSTMAESVSTTADTDLARKRAKTNSSTVSDSTVEQTQSSSGKPALKESVNTNGAVTVSSSGSSHALSMTGETNEDTNTINEHVLVKTNGVNVKKEPMEEVADRHIPSERLVQDAQRYLPLYTVQYPDDDSAGAACETTSTTKTRTATLSTRLSSCVVDRQVQLLLGLKQGTLFSRYPHLHRRLVTTREKTRLWSPLSSMVSDRCAAAVKLNYEVLPAECQFSSWSTATTAMSRLKEYEKQKFLGCELYFIRLEEVLDLIRQDYGQLNESMMTIMLDIGYDDEELEMEVDMDDGAQVNNSNNMHYRNDDSLRTKVKVEESDDQENVKGKMTREVKEEETENLAVGHGGDTPLFISTTPKCTSTSLSTSLSTCSVISEPLSAPASFSSSMGSMTKLMRVPAKMATKAMFKEMQQQYRQP